MRKSGFTLVELLGVIVILSVLSLIAIPVIDRSLNQGKDNLSSVQEKQLIKALKNYYAENISKYSKISTDVDNPSCETIGDLKSFGYLPTDLEDPKTGSPLSEDIKVCAYKDGNLVKYVIKEES